MNIFNENPIEEEKPEKNFNELDAEVIRKLQNDEIDVDEVVKNLEKWYKGEKEKHF